MPGVIVYALCLLTSALCAVLLLREYRRAPTPLLLWSGVSFVFWAANNAVLFADLVLVRDFDLSLVRTSLAVIAVGLLLYGLVRETA